METTIVYWGYIGVMEKWKLLFRAQGLGLGSRIWV